MENLDSEFEMRQRIEILEAKVEMVEKDRDRYKAKFEKYNDIFELAGIGNHLTYSNIGLPEITAEGQNRIIELLIKGKHMEILENAAKEDENVKQAFERLTLFIRLSGSKKPEDPKPGDIWIDTLDNTTYVSTEEEFNTLYGQPSAIDSLINSDIFLQAPISSRRNQWNIASTSATSWDVFELTTLKVNGSSRSIRNSELARLVAQEEEIKKLAEEQPAVKEAYENLNMLIKLFRNEDESRG